MSLSALERRDEILQVMFWLEGEGFVAAAATVDLLPFLRSEAAEHLASDLQALQAAALVEAFPDGRFRLTEAGNQEAGRRFEEEFRGLTGVGHGGCSDPECDCHTHGAQRCTYAHQLDEGNGPDG